MTSEHDHAVAERLYAEPLTAATVYTRHQTEALLRDWARHNPPRRFALYRTIEDNAGCDGGIFAWGLAYEHYIVVRSLDELLHGRFVSAESMLTYIRRTWPHTGMVWIDPQYLPQ